MKQTIVGFHQDDVGEWVAELSCGHTQHVRHKPPLVSRPWVLSEAGRQRFLGFQLACKLCGPVAGEDAGHAPPDGQQ